ncbi:MAG TPA: class I SAM-dependent methyltransferase [Myxococcota bacterium]|nr:class I SAM-dependent methyltransferase [Myxococcota bacterium]
MTARPAHLSAEYAAQFADRAVVAAYAARPPYPEEVFAILESLLPSSAARVLELGCGSGDLTLRLAARVGRVDAVDVSEPMLERARARAGARHPNVTWIATPVEAFAPSASYSQIVAAESLHWMDWDVALPSCARWLDENGVLAIVDGRLLAPLPWDAELRALIAEHSTNRDFRPLDLVEELTKRGLFRELGRRRTAPIAVEQRADDYVESFHSRNGFSRERMSRESALAFDRALRAAIQRHSPDMLVRASLTALVVWGRPLSP